MVHVTSIVLATAKVMDKVINRDKYIRLEKEDKKRRQELSAHERRSEALYAVYSRML